MPANLRNNMFIHTYIYMYAVFVYMVYAYIPVYLCIYMHAHALARGHELARSSGGPLVHWRQDAWIFVLGPSEFQAGRGRGTTKRG